MQMPDGKLHIAVDLDDVVLDFMGGVQRAVSTEYAVDLSDFEQWDLHTVLDPVIGYSWWKWLRQRDWLWPNFSAIPGSIGGIDSLRRDGHYLECVTSKPEWAEAAVWKWLGKWRPAFHRVTIVSPDGPPKVQMTEADLLIDDKWSNVNEFVYAGRLGWLFDRGHNQGVQLDRRVSRVKGWAQVVEKTRKMGAEHVTAE